MIWREMKIAASYRGFKLLGVDCSTFEIISYPDLLLTKAKARSGQIRSVHVIVLAQERRNITRFRENKEAEDASLLLSNPIIIRNLLSW